MQNTMLLALCSALDITATGAQDGIAMNVSPFKGGYDHNAILVLQNAIAGGGVVKVQGNPTIQPNAPASDDANWSDIATLQAGSPILQEIELPPWIRVNVTTVGTGTASLSLLGVQ